MRASKTRSSKTILIIAVTVVLPLATVFGMYALAEQAASAPVSFSELTFEAPPASAVPQAEIPEASSGQPQPAEELPQETPAPTAAPEPQKKTGALAGLTIGLDPGHQEKGDSDKEPESPGSSTMKKKVSSGTQGRFTGVPEYQVNLDVGLLLQELLVEADATVVMTRTTNDVNISNSERAVLFNDNEVDLGVRLHCNGSEDEDVHGAFMLVPKSESYPFYQENVEAAECILKYYGEETGISIKKALPTEAIRRGSIGAQDQS